MRGVCAGPGHVGATECLTGWRCPDQGEWEFICWEWECEDVGKYEVAWVCLDLVVDADDYPSSVYEWLGESSGAAAEVKQAGSGLVAGRVVFRWHGHG